MLGPVITGILATRNVLPEYVTTVLYPISIVDEMVLLPSSLLGGTLWTGPLDDMTVGPSIISGLLTTTIAYWTYNEPIYVEEMAVVPSIVAGTLTTTIAYKTYNEPIYVEEMSVVPSIVAGTLTTTIAYPTYNNWIAEDLALVPSLIAGTLS